MSNLINKSNHPVEVKKIHIQMWTLRDEVEAAIEKRIKENPDVEHSEVNIDDIKEYYHNIIGGANNLNQNDESEDDEEDQENLDSSGNPLDEDALAMMAAIGGDADENEDNKQDDIDEIETAQEENEEDDDAAKMAAEMLEGQTSEEDPAAAAAAAMLADQGLGTEEDNNAEAAALAMLEGQVENSEDITPKKFSRLKPSKSKIIDGFIMLSDIQMDQVLVFSKEGFVHGQNIILEFQLTKKFTVSATVKVVTNISRNSKIISEKRPNFRIQGILLFQFPEEREKLRNFLKSIEPTIPAPPKKVRKAEEDDDEDDFDDLGF